jgi:ubiquitin-conjugating enzyme E2 variant
MNAIHIIAAIFAAEVLSGAVHWWEDRYGNPDWPVVGTHVIQPNIRHHTDQMAFTRGSYFDRNWTTLLPTLLIAAVAGALGYYWTALVFAIASQSNEIHCLSHQRCSRPIRGLQLLGILQSPEQHASHHTRPFDRNYCVMTDFTNPILQAVGFWQAIEFGVALFGIRPRPEREVA